MARGEGCTDTTAATARGSLTGVDLTAAEERPYGVTSRRALGLDDPISPLYPMPDDRPGPEEPLGADEVAALDPINAARVAFGYKPLAHLRGGKRNGWTRHDSVGWALVKTIPLGVRLTPGVAFNQEHLTLRVPTGLDFARYDEAVTIVEKLAEAFGVELQRGPQGAPMARYGMGSVEYIVPLPDALRTYLGAERIPGWQPSDPRPAGLPPRLREHNHIGPVLKRKSDMYKLYEQGAFGNKLRTWPTTDDLLASDYSGSVTLRYKGKAGGGGWCAYDLALDQVTPTIEQWVSEGADPKLITANESAPDERLVVQGDVGRNPAGGGGLVFRYSRDRVKMRTAMETATHAYGAEAVVLLDSYLSPDSLADVKELLELFPDAIVEFSAYEMNVGDKPGRNAVIWEVRNY